MSISFKSFCFASTALSLSLGAFAAEAAVIPLPVGTDLDFSHTAGTPKGYFTSVAPVGWTGGGSLIFVRFDQTSERAGRQPGLPHHLWKSYRNRYGELHRGGRQSELRRLVQPVDLGSDGGAEVLAELLPGRQHADRLRHDQW